MLRTRAPLSVLLLTVRLACIRPAASVHPEPGSNSPLYKFLHLLESKLMSSADPTRINEKVSFVVALFALPYR